MKTKFFLIFLFSLLTTNCFSSEIENFKRKYILSMLGNVYSVAINPNGTQIAAETTVGYQVFDLITGKELFTFLQAHSKHIRFIYSPDGSQIMAPIDNEIIIWDSKTGKELRRLKIEMARTSLASAVYSPDGKYIAASARFYSGDMSYYLLTWDVNSGRQLLDNISGGDNYIFYSKDGKNIGYTYGNGNDNISSVSAGTGEKQDISDSIFYPINFQSIAREFERIIWGERSFSPDGLRFAKVSRVLVHDSREDDGKDDAWEFSIQIFDSKTGRKLTEHLGSSPLSIQPVVIMYNPQGTRIFAGLSNGSIRIWDSTTGQEITTQNYNNVGSISSAQFSKDGNYLVIGTSNGNIVLMGK